MIDYLKFLFSKIVTLGDKLNSTALLQNKTWVRISADGNYEKWFFQSNGLLTISKNGNVVNGSYRFLNNYLVIDNSYEKILVNQSLIHKQILLLKKDSSKSEFFAFYDDSKFSPQEFMQHLEESRRVDLNIKQLNLTDGSKVEIIRNPNQTEINIGNTVLLDNQFLNQDIIESKNYFYELSDSKISSIFYKRKYKIYNNEITVKQKNKEICSKDIIVDSKEKLDDGFYKIEYNNGIIIKNGGIDKLYFITYWNTLLFNRKIEVWQKSKYERNKGDLVREKFKPVKDGKYWIEPFSIINTKNGEIY